MIITKPTRESNQSLKFGATNIEAARNFSYFMNDYFLNAVINGEEDLNYLDTLERYNKQ